jgi:hypothetical protein
MHPWLSIWSTKSMNLESKRFNRNEIAALAQIAQNARLPCSHLWLQTKAINVLSVRFTP